MDIYRLHHHEPPANYDHVITEPGSTASGDIDPLSGKSQQRQ
jgi:hypothetical protein